MRGWVSIRDASCSVMVIDVDPADGVVVRCRWGCWWGVGMGMNTGTGWVLIMSASTGRDPINGCGCGQGPSKGYGDGWGSAERTSAVGARCGAGDSSNGYGGAMGMGTAGRSLSQWGLGCLC